MKLPTRIKGAIFDLDGTLLDSLHVWQDVDAKFFARRGIPMPPDYLHAVKSLELHAAAEYTIRRFSLPEQPDELVREWLDLVREEYTTHVELKPYAEELLKFLSARGIKLAVATSCSRELFLPVLERHGVAKLFSALVVTREAARGKEFPDVYLLAAERIGLPPSDCAVFEDILVGIRSANVGGFYTVAVEDLASVHDREILQAEADLFIDSFRELL